MFDWFANTWNELKTFLYSLVLTVQDIMKDIGIFFFKSFMDISITAIHGLDSCFSGLDVASYFDDLPSGVIYYASALGLSQAMGMIITALSIRMSLQLIPFVRLGN